MKADRYFYSAAAGLFLVLMLTGFHAFVLRGMGFEDRQIDPKIFVLDAVHGSAIAAWFVLFLAQSLLITVRNRKLHMKLGWAAVALGPTIAVTGTMVAIESVKLTPKFIFFGFLYSRFLLVMLFEMAMFAVFITAGVLTRKKPRIHRTMMLLTSLTLLPGATARIAALVPIFGATGWMGLFGPVFCLGAILFAIRWAMTRRFDAWFAASYGLLVVAYLGSTFLAVTETWDRMAVMFIG